MAKNYLKEDEIKELNRVVGMWLDFAEDQALRKKQVFLKDWESKLNEFLKFNDRKVLPSAGKVSKERAEAKALAEYEAFASVRRGLLEAEGETASIAALEAVVRRAPAKDKTKRK